MREKQGQNTTGIVRRPKQSKRDRILRAASTWQEVSVKNNKNSPLPGLGREEQSMARTLVPLNSAVSVAASLFFLVWSSRKRLLELCCHRMGETADTDTALGDTALGEKGEFRLHSSSALFLWATLGYLSNYELHFKVFQMIKKVGWRGTIFLFLILRWGNSETFL